MQYTVKHASTVDAPCDYTQPGPWKQVNSHLQRDRLFRTADTKLARCKAWMQNEAGWRMRSASAISNVQH